MADVNMVVVREYAMKNGLTPTGRKIGVSKVANTALYRIAFVDEKPGKLPEPYDAMMYTTTKLAQEDLDKFLKVQWDKSDAEESKKAKNTLADLAATQQMIQALDPIKNKEVKSAATAG